jgi:hypothetical protein
MRWSITGRLIRWCRKSRNLLVADGKTLAHVIRFANAAPSSVICRRWMRFLSAPARSNHPEVDTGSCDDGNRSRRVENYSLPVRFAALKADLGKGTTPPEEWPHHKIRGSLVLPRIYANASGRLMTYVTLRCSSRYHGDVHRAPSCAHPPLRPCAGSGCLSQARDVSRSFCGLLM